MKTPKNDDRINTAELGTTSAFSEVPPLLSKCPIRQIYFKLVNVSRRVLSSEMYNSQKPLSKKRPALIPQFHKMQPKNFNTCHRLTRHLISKNHFCLDLSFFHRSSPFQSISMNCNLILLSHSTTSFQPPTLKP